MYVLFLLPPLLVVQLQVVVVVLPAVSLALSFSLSPLVVRLLLLLPVLLPADRVAAALRVPNKQNPRKVSVSSGVTRKNVITWLIYCSFCETQERKPRLCETSVSIVHSKKEKTKTTSALPMR